MHPSRRAVWLCSATAQALHPRAAHAPACDIVRPAEAHAGVKLGNGKRESAGDDDSGDCFTLERARERACPSACPVETRATNSYITHPRRSLLASLPLAHRRLGAPARAPPAKCRRAICRTPYKCIVHVYCARETSEQPLAKKSVCARVEAARDSGGFRFLIPQLIAKCISLLRVKSLRKLCIQFKLMRNIFYIA